MSTEAADWSRQLNLHIWKRKMILKIYISLLTCLLAAIAATNSFAESRSASLIDSIPQDAVLSGHEMAEVEGRVAPLVAVAAGTFAGAVSGAIVSYATTGQVQASAVWGGAVGGATGAIGTLATIGTKVTAGAITYWTTVSTVNGGAGAVAGQHYENLVEALEDSSEGEVTEELNGAWENPFDELDNPHYDDWSSYTNYIQANYGLTVTSHVGSFSFTVPTGSHCANCGIINVPQ